MCIRDSPNPFRARERSQGKEIILVVDHYVPTFDKDAGSKTTYQYLKMFLKKGYVVKFLSLIHISGWRCWKHRRLPVLLYRIKPPL